MIEIKDKKGCTGCGACLNACPYDLISLREDEEGFVYPLVDINRCVNCHLCENACPMLRDRGDICMVYPEYPQFFAGQLKNKEDLLEVSSGGAFWAFALAVIEVGGVVYGAIQEDVDHVFHAKAECLDDIKKFRRSKYFQSDTGITFRQVKEDLDKGRTILYSGTGCQIAGLKGYLNKEYDNLYTCEVVCHGVPSRRVWNAYRQEKEKKEGKRIIDLVFRDKTAGWSHNQYKITYEDGSVEKEASTQQLFHAGYLRGLFYRPSCSNCRFAALPRVADISLADYWKYEGLFCKFDNDLGVSLITVNNEKGNKLLHHCTKYLEIETTRRELALSSCKHLQEHPLESPNREEFFKSLNNTGFHKAAEKYIIRPLYKKVFIYSLRLVKKTFRL